MSTVSAGSLPESAKDVSADLKSRLGPLAYLIKGFQALHDEYTKKFKLVLDEKKLTGDSN